MKKINSLTQLRAEKQRLQLLRMQQEGQLREEWHTLKSMLRPSGILSSVFDRKPSTGESPRKDTVSKFMYRKLASWLLQKLANRHHKAG
ncbi:MAG: hypothetical protein KA821_00495 [Chitinophagaceae bacterium]|nr:hypothetical protein [Chitinophagaceae bacterium]